MKSGQTNSIRGGFSLVELLVVIGIIGVLIAILLPTLSRAQKQARSVACQSNLRQLGMLLATYTSENKGWLFPVGPDGLDGEPTTFGTNYPPNERWPMRLGLRSSRTLRTPRRGATRRTSSCRTSQTSSQPSHTRPG